MTFSRRLLGGLCIAMLLAGVAGGAAGKPPSIAFSQASFALASGHGWGTISRGKACDRSSRDLLWDPSLGNTAAADFPARFAETLAKSVGLRPRPGLRIEGAVAELDARLCEVARKRATGTLGMGVTWRILDPAKDEPVAVIETHAAGDAGEIAVDAPAPLLDAAFRANVEALVADPAFRKAIRPPPRRRAKPAVAAIEVPLAPMVLMLAGAGVPMPLDQAAQGVVSIITDKALGSGLLITADGYLLTNAHVVGAAKTVTVRWPDGRETLGEVVRTEARRDVALIRTDPPTVRPLIIRRRPVSLAETVYAIGTPRETQFAGTLTRGVVSTTQRVIAGQTFIQSDVAITHGESGGPLLDHKGWVVGVTQSTYEPGGVSQNINFFIPIDEALRALALRPAG